MNETLSNELNQLVDRIIRDNPNGSIDRLRAAVKRLDLDKLNHRIEVSERPYVELRDAIVGQVALDELNARHQALGIY